MRVVAFFGDSGSGKTTLVERLIAWFSQQGWRVNAIKHAHHGFDMDRPGKDSWRFREAGAAQVLVASDRHWALLGRETESADTDPDAALARHLSRLDRVDFIFIEGFRSQNRIPGVYVERRPQESAPVPEPKQARELVAARAGLFAWVSDDDDAVPLVGVPRFHPDDIAGIGKRLWQLPLWEG